MLCLRSFPVLRRTNSRKPFCVPVAFLSCFAALTQVSGQSNGFSALVEVPVRLQQGDLLVGVRVNDSDPKTFKLDTGFGITTISPNLADSLQLERVGGLTIDGIAGEERAETYRGAVFDLGGMNFRPRRVAALPSERQSRQKTRDGIFGADFFRRFVVEIDVANRRMRLHEPSSFVHNGPGEVIPLQFRRD